MNKENQPSVDKYILYALEGAILLASLGLGSFAVQSLLERWLSN